MTRIVRTAAVTGLALIVGVAALATRTPATNPPMTEHVEDSVTSFAFDHPEWAVLRNDRRDATPLRMGHAKHLDRNLRRAPPGGLRCVDCHVPDTSGRYMEPISFDAHCQSCHEENLGTINIAEGVIEREPAPHGAVVEISLALDRKLGEWAQAQPDRFVIAPNPAPGEATGQPATESPPAEPSAPQGKKRRPADRDKAKAEVPAFKSVTEREDWFVEQRATVLSSLASGSRCGYCHTAIVDPIKPGELFEVRAPNIPDRWLPRAHFSHLSHEMLRCNECHHIANASHDTSHILLPTIDSCRRCHAPTSVGAGAPDACVLCHTYHQEPPPSQGLRVVDDLRRKR